MSKSKFKIAAHLIIKVSDGQQIDHLMEFSEATERALFFIRCDMEYLLTSLVSVSVVVGKHLRYYYESNHHGKHVSYYG